MPVAQCHLCSCFYISVAISEEDLAKMYEQYWSVTCPRPLTEEMGLYLTASAYNRYCRDHCLNRLAALIGSWKSKKVLDVGCGFGEKASMMKSVGAAVSGVDISPEAVNFCNRMLGFEAHCMTIEELPSHYKEFDVITMFEFVEHPVEPLTILQNAVNRLKTGGFIVIVTPNGTAGERWWLDREYEWGGFRADLEHLQYLHVETIDYLCHKLNCRLMHLDQLGHRSVDMPKQPQAATPAMYNKARKMIKGLPFVRNMIYGLRNFQANMHKISNNPADTGDYHLFAILQKKA